MQNEYTATMASIILSTVFIIIWSFHQFIKNWYMNQEIKNYKTNIWLNPVSFRVHKHINVFIFTSLLLWNKQEKTYFCSPNWAQLLPFSTIISAGNKEAEELPLWMFSLTITPHYKNSPLQAVFLSCRHLHFYA